MNPIGSTYGIVPYMNGWFSSLGIQSPCQRMIGVANRLLGKVFRFHYHSQNVIGSLGHGKCRYTYQSHGSYGVGNGTIYFRKQKSRILCHSPTWKLYKVGPYDRYKWSYNPYKWPYKWVTGVITSISPGSPKAINSMVFPKRPLFY